MLIGHVIIIFFEHLFKSNSFTHILIGLSLFCFDSFFGSERQSPSIEVGGGVEREKEREIQADSLLSPEPNKAQSHDHTIITCAEIKNQMPSHLSHPGVPGLSFF